MYQLMLYQCKLKFHKGVVFNLRAVKAAILFFPDFGN